MMHQYQFEGDQAAISVHVAVAGGAQHGAFVVDVSFVELRWERHAALAAGDGVPHHGLGPRAVDEEGEAVAAAEEEEALAGSTRLPRQGEALGWDAVRRRQRRDEDGPARVAEEVAEQGRRRPVVVLAEAAEEERVRDEASPAFAHEGRARERRRQRRQAQEDLAEEIVVVRQRHRPHWCCGCTFRSSDATPGRRGMARIVVRRTNYCLLLSEWSSVTT